MAEITQKLILRISELLSKLNKCGTTVLVPNDIARTLKIILDQGLKVMFLPFNPSTPSSSSSMSSVS